MGDDQSDKGLEILDIIASAQNTRAPQESNRYHSEILNTGKYAHLGRNIAMVPDIAKANRAALMAEHYAQQGMLIKNIYAKLYTRFSGIKAFDQSRSQFL